MKPGAIAHIECPYDLVYGGASIQAPIGGEWIPKYSDVDFDLEVKYCNHNPGTNGSLYWGDDLSFWDGPPELKPGNCVEISGANEIDHYWKNPPAKEAATWIIYTNWGSYVSVWTGAKDAT